MKIHIQILLCAAALATAACNGDIFTDRNELPDFADITVEGDGGEWSAPIERDGLLRIYIDYSESVKPYVHYYDTDGNPADASCPASDLGSIVFENPVTFYSIGLHEEMLYVTSNYNAAGADNVTLHLEYDSGVTKLIHLTITQGEPLQLSFCIYDGEIVTEENVAEQTHTERFTNRGPIPQRMEIMPYRASQCSDVAMPAEQWARKLTVDMPMLVYVPALVNFGYEWQLQDFTDICLGDLRTFTPEEYMDEKFFVEVPPGVKATVTWTLHYTRASQQGRLDFYNAVTDSYTSDVRFECTVLYPTSYDYTVSYEE